MAPETGPHRKCINTRLMFGTWGHNVTLLTRPNTSLILSNLYNGLKLMNTDCFLNSLCTNFSQPFNLLSLYNLISVKPSLLICCYHASNVNQFPIKNYKSLISLCFYTHAFENTSPLLSSAFIFRINHSLPPSPCSLNISSSVISRFFHYPCLLHSMACLEIWRGRGGARGYISGVHFQQCSKFSIQIFFHIKY